MKRTRKVLSVILRVSYGFLRSCHSWSSDQKLFDVVVVGGGHAGVEACCAASRMGAKTLLVTHKKETIGEMSCNPAFGGIGKGHLIKEVDALDGVCGRICDLSGINYRILNASKGPAVWGPRAQIDRKLYKKEMQNEIFNKTTNLEVLAAAVDDLIIDPETNTCKGIVTQNGDKIKSHTVVLTTGTFLNGEIYIGLDVRPAGRISDEPSIPLAMTLKRLGFRISRLKTGTPPRLKKDTIDFSLCEVQEPDNPPNPFSFMNDKVWIRPEDQIVCYRTCTNEKVVKIVIENLHQNLHYVKEEVNGPRYCPSLESKCVRFGDRSHVIWLEPEGLDSDLVYPSGMSCTLPEELQVRLVREIKGLEKAEVVRPGYGVQYDFVDPRELKRNLETIKIQNLFFAGQINGTTGYEEAAAQGVIAGINAAAKCQSKDEFLVSRSEAYIGVLIDDLTNLGTNEPYRMFTSRAEFRMYLRPDNADLRLTKKGYEIGCVSEERYRKTLEIEERVKEALSILKTTIKPLDTWLKILKQPIYYNPTPKSAFQVIRILSAKRKCTNMDAIYSDVFEVLRNRRVRERVIIESLYESALKEELADIAEVKRDEAFQIPSNFDYTNLKGLSDEERTNLDLARPQTIAAASRIPGVSPTTLVRLLKIIKRSSTIGVKMPETYVGFFQKNQLAK